MDKINKQSAGEQVTNTLRQAIYKGKLLAGEEITQIGIAEMLGVSRMPVREAFQHLADEGLITIQTNRRVIVSKITREDIVDHYEIRALLEGHAAKKAAINTDYHQKIKEIHLKSLAVDGITFVDLNEQFHKLIWEATNSDRLINLLTNLWNSTQSQMPILHPNRMKNSIDEHSKIMDAILKQNEKDAFQYMHNHILVSKDDFIQNFNF